MDFVKLGILMVLGSLWCIDANTVNEDVNYQNALLKISTSNDDNLIVKYRNTECSSCLQKTLAELNKNKNVSVTINTEYPSYYLFIINRKDGVVYCPDLSANPFTFGENGTYKLMIQVNSNGSYASVICNITTETEPIPLYTPIYIALGVFIGTGLLYALLKNLHRKYYPTISEKYMNINVVNSEFGIPNLANSSTYLIENPPPVIKSKKAKSNSGRMKSVDVFRGLCLAIMIFANYGAGGYTFLVIFFHFENRNYLFEYIQTKKYRSG